jgi:serine protease Do
MKATGMPRHSGKVWAEAPPADSSPLAITSKTFIELARKVNPAVVNIFTETRVPTRVGGPLGIFTIRTPFLDFSANALGTGFLISTDGFLLTNAHVVSRAVEIKIFLWKTSEVKKARLIGIDRPSDLALLKIEDEEPLPYLPLADASSVQVGEMVVAIGNPYGLQHSLTDGLISAKNRKMPSESKDSCNDFLQTSALINPGNSGGPLINLQGEVVGVNTAIVAGSQGIGFAVPSDLIKEILPHLTRSGKVDPGQRRKCEEPSEPQP